MPALAAKLALALGFDTVLQWVIRLLVALVVAGLIVTLIVIQTLAGILTGDRSGSDAASSPPAVARTPALPAPIARPTSEGDLGDRVVQVAQLWLGVPYVFGGPQWGGLQLPGAERLRCVGDPFTTCCG